VIAVGCVVLVLIWKVTAPAYGAIAAGCGEIAPAWKVTAPAWKVTAPAWKVIAVSWKVFYMKFLQICDHSTLIYSIG
jgi:hypothetical protein